MHLVLLPGMDGTGELFGPLTRALPDDVAVTIVRYPLDELLSYEELHSYIRQAVPDGQPYALLAESFSGPLAIEHAAKRPAQLRALVLCATFAANPLPRVMRWLRWLARPVLFMVPPPATALRWFLLGSDGSAELLAAVRSAVRAVRPSVMAHRVRIALDVGVGPRLGSLRVPVLYLGGARDRLVGRRGLAQIALELPELESVVLDGPHLLLQTLPEEAAAEIMRFLRGTACV